MKISRTQIRPRRPQVNSPSEKVSFSADSGSKSSKLKTGLIMGGSALAGAAIINADKVGQIVDTVGSAVAPAMTIMAPIFLGAAEGGVAGAVAGVGYGMISTAGRHDSAPAFAAVGGLVGGALVGGLAGGISGAFGVSPLLAAPVVIAGAAYMTSSK